MSQQVASPHPATLIGEGKVQELQERIVATKATLAIFDEELSPVQGANLERDLKVRVMDRAEVILDIFSTRARSHEAKLQVELAQLEYMLPRLTRMWTHLSRIRGGIGLRGPGETQLETDRRMIRQKISLLRSKLRDVERHRETIRSGRQPLLSVALVGYTNAGKSSILRSLSPSSDVLVEDRLFATLDTLTREIDLGEGTRVRLTDTVGFIRKLPHHLVASFRATLEEVREGDVLLHIVDVSHPQWEEQMDVVTAVLAELGAGEQEIVPIFNKIDAVPDSEAVAERVRGLFANAVIASATRPDGLEELKARLRELARRERPAVSVRVPIGDGARLAEIYRLGEVVSREQVNGVFELRVRLDPAEVSRLRNIGVEVR
jgi:GTP-binding protein HflX